MDVQTFFKRFRKGLILFVGLNLVVTGLSMLIPYRLAIQMSDSIKCRIVAWKPVDSYIPAKNDLVIFKPGSGYGPLGPDIENKLFIKWVKGIPGDYLSCSPLAGCFVNGKPVGSVIPNDKISSTYTYQGYIPDGWFAPFGEVERSYDTRFGGLVSTNQVVGVAIGCI